jgi:hypothetical protein
MVYTYVLYIIAAYAGLQIIQVSTFYMKYFHFYMHTDIKKKKILYSVQCVRWLTSSVSNSKWGYTVQ